MTECYRRQGPSCARGRSERVYLLKTPASSPKQLLALREHPLALTNNRCTLVHAILLAPYLHTGTSTILFSSGFHHHLEHHFHYQDTTATLSKATQLLLVITRQSSSITNRIRFCGTKADFSTPTP